MVTPKVVAKNQTRDSGDIDKAIWGNTLSILMVAAHYDPERGKRKWIARLLALVGVG